MFVDPDGLIESFEWGKFMIDGVVHGADGEGVGKDICIVDGQVTAWSARQGHRLTPEMVDCALRSGVKVLVIGNGVYGRLQVPRKTKAVVTEAGIEKLIIERTHKACEIFNQRFRKGEPVAFLGHGTC